MINVYSNSGDTAYGIREYVVDTVADIENLPKTKVELGSAALCLEDGNVYFYNPSKNRWAILGT
jgi:hypothetical protein